MLSLKCMAVWAGRLVREGGERTRGGGREGARGGRGGRDTWQVAGRGHLRLRSDAQRFPPSPEALP